MINLLTNKGNYFSMINSIIKNDDSKQIGILQIAHLILIEVIKIFNKNNMSTIDIGYDLVKPISYISKKSVSFHFNLG